MIEEPDHLVLPVQSRSGVAVVGKLVGPVADDRAARCGAVLEHAEDGIHVGIHPATEQQNRGLDPVVVWREGALPPVRTVHLMLEPAHEPDRRQLEPRLPRRDPVLARARRQCREGIRCHLADGVLGELRGRDAAADEVDVAEVAIVRCVHGHDRS